MNYTWEKKSHLEKLATIEKLCHRWKKESHLEMGNTCMLTVVRSWKTGLQLEELVKLGKVGNREIFDFLKRERDICVQAIITSKTRPSR